ncbi:hypothetical protein AK812_SmicGene19816 [Symbiodinium microadriaticum]|uniref:Uncharacterized protein n=1 Tax=Symbiodinium microadriaticum TaxID=2951 RepID=A0A1Q9DRL4_SYMMI|nr:hypothetical protein AK812_SmicGene19816 [Symbiodinium microadriaticum]CAE7721267.1 unnamed protein product [Symbiodinium microadriaticum]CAE7859556.1 unnamed protein product [Symbiodinium sp. KB8]
MMPLQHPEARRRTWPRSCHAVTCGIVWSNPWSGLSFGAIVLLLACLVEDLMLFVNAALRGPRGPSPPRLVWSQGSHVPLTGQRTYSTRTASGVITRAPVQLVSHHPQVPRLCLPNQSGQPVWVQRAAVEPGFSGVPSPVKTLSTDMLSRSVQVVPLQGSSVDLSASRSGYPAHAVDTLSRTVSACRHVPEHGSFRAASPTRLALGCLASPKAKPAFYRAVPVEQRLPSEACVFTGAVHRRMVSPGRAGPVAAGTLPAKVR